MNFVISLIPLAMLMLLFRHPITPAILFVPVAFVILLVLTSGVSFIIATIAVFFDDITQFYQVLLQAVMYLTALFYPISIVPPSWRIFIELNPLYHVCTFALFRSVSGRKEWTPIPRLNPDRS